MKARKVRTLNSIFFLALAGIAAWQLSVAAGNPSGTLRLSIVDAASEQPTPARVEVIDSNGHTHIAEDAVLVGPGSPDREHPWNGNLDRALSLLSRSIENPYTRTAQFYSAAARRTRWRRTRPKRAAS